MFGRERQRIISWVLTTIRGSGRAGGGQSTFADARLENRVHVKRFNRPPYAREKRSDIEAALIEGLESGPVEEWTAKDWEDMKQCVTQRHQSS